MPKITLYTCLSYPNGLDEPPIISTSPSISGQTPPGLFTGFYGTRDRNTFLAAARRKCIELEWPFSHVEIDFDAPGFSPSRQDWANLQNGNVLSLFKTKADVEKALASLVDASSLETKSTLDKQTLRRLNMPGAKDMMDRLFNDSRMPNLEMVIWGLLNINAAGYAQVATLKSLHTINPENVKVFDYRSKIVPVYDPNLN